VPVFAEGTIHKPSDIVNLIWINVLGQHSHSYYMMPNGGGLDASLMQSPLVDFQGLERLESSPLKLC
jgi:hypothetical protein